MRLPVSRTIYRAYMTPHSSMPVFVRSCGYYKFAAPFMEPVKKKHFLELFWVSSGRCIFVYEKKRHEVGTGSVFFYLPGDVHHVEVPSGGTEYYWMTISGEKVWELIRFLSIKRGARYAGLCPTNQFFKLDSVLRDPSDKSEQEAGKIAFSILADAVYGVAQEANVAESFKIMVRKNLADAGLRVASLAAELKIHRTTLHKIMRKETGLSPQQYILRCRIQDALSLMLDTRQSIKEIAEKCGFPDQNYFAKVIRQHFGHTPSEIRGGVN